MRPGFTLVELVVVILVVAVISAISVPSVMKRSNDAKLAATISQMLQIEKAARHYKSVHGSWPRDTVSGVTPSAIRAYLPGIDFTQTPLGGSYDWNGPGTSISFIGISAKLERNGFSSKELVRMDGVLDDGNLRTGYVRLLRGVYFQLCLEET